jgi:predicted small lipoprotein YifL
MLRHSRSVFRALATALVVLIATSACGIKGPLTPAKKAEPEATKDAAKDAAKAPAAAKP